LLKDWRDSAACKGLTALFFKHNCDVHRCRNGCRSGNVDKAKAICASCPVLGQCYTAAILEQTYDDGVIAGTTKRERIALRKAMR